MGQTHSGGDDLRYNQMNSLIDSSSKVNTSESSTIKTPVADVCQVDLNSSNIRKRFTRLGTIRRKLARTLRSAKNSDYHKHIRDLLHSWTHQEIKSFIKEYDGLESLKELQKFSISARQKSSCIQSDLKKLYVKKLCCDLVIEYKNELFHVHKSFLCARCRLFGNYISNSTLNSNGHLEINVNDLDLPLPVFKSLISYMYSGHTDNQQLILILPQIAKSFGNLSTVKSDMIALYESKSQTDLRLVFKNHLESGSHVYVDKEGSIDNTLHVHCHIAVLSARSKYFHSLLRKTFKKKQNNDEYELIISEKIIPRAYIRVVLYCLYTDILDLTSVIKWKVADDGSGEADRLLTTSELAMELYEIGQFLEFPKLMECCEDVIVSNLNVSSLLGVLEWSAQPFGSCYVQRQALHYFREEFCSLCKTSLFLANLPQRFLLEVIKSDFLQANEEFVLATIIKWGEWKIVKSSEKPGTSPANSLPSRSPKRRDINNDVLREMIADLLPHVRVQHILPPNSSVLNMAYQRRLLQRPFPFDVVAAAKQVPNMVYWLRECRHKDYKRPRWFMHYVHEAKLFLHERLAEADHSNGATRLTEQLPDMLPLHHTMTHEPPSITHTDEQDVSAPSILDIIQLDSGTVKAMVLREKELKTSPEALKALSLAPDTHEISTEIQLRVVREFGLPDETASKIFQQTPDLLEDSGSSSNNSSKQSTLSKIGHLLSNIGTMTTTHQTQECDEPLADMHYSQGDLLSKTTLLLNRDKDAVSSSYDNPLVDGSPVRPIDDSPLDLPLTDNVDMQLPNVLLDT